LRLFFFLFLSVLIGGIWKSLHEFASNGGKPVGKADWQQAAAEIM